MQLTAKQQIRVDVLTKYLNGQIYLSDALEILEIKERQFRRVIKRFREKGICSVLHGNVGRKPPNKTSEFVEHKIIKEYSLKYFDLNVTHFMEFFLADFPDLRVPSKSTVRKILLREKLISPVKRKKRRLHPMRKRYEKEGIMVQIDGSHHRWFTGQAPLCLTAAIDDATGKIVGAKFTKTETTFAAMDVVESIIKEKGCFQMLYSDRAGIYGNGKREGYSNLERALRELGISSLRASTPQAKGRVERLFKTLQSRLCAELRLNGINSMKDGNEFLESIFIEKFNKQFGVEPHSEELAYKELDKKKDLNEIFSVRDHRIISNGHVISLNSEKLQVESKDYLVGRSVEVRHYRDGSTKFLVSGKFVKVTRLFEDKKGA